VSVKKTWRSVARRPSLSLRAQPNGRSGNSNFEAILASAYLPVISPTARTVSHLTLLIVP